MRKYFHDMLCIQNQLVISRHTEFHEKVWGSNNQRILEKKPSRNMFLLLCMLCIPFIFCSRIFNITCLRNIYFSYLSIEIHTIFSLKHNYVPQQQIKLLKGLTYSGIQLLMVVSCKFLFILKPLRVRRKWKKKMLFASLQYCTQECLFFLLWVCLSQLRQQLNVHLKTVSVLLKEEHLELSRGSRQQHCLHLHLHSDPNQQKPKSSWGILWHATKLQQTRKRQA